MRAIVSFAKGQLYENLARNLYDSVSRFYTGDMYIFKDESKIPSPLHSEYPYVFKPYAFKKLFEKGYKTVLWLDSSITVIKSLSYLFKYIETNGSYFYNDGANCARFTNDKMLEHFNISRDEAEKIPQIYASVIGLSNTNKSKEFLDKWLESVPYFKGSWNNDNKTESQDSRCAGHRHDQSAASIIAYNMDILKSREETNKYVQVCCGLNKITEDTCLKTK